MSGAHCPRLQHPNLTAALPVSGRPPLSPARIHCEATTSSSVLKRPLPIPFPSHFSAPSSVARSDIARPMSKHASVSTHNTSLVCWVIVVAVLGASYLFWQVATHPHNAAPQSAPGGSKGNTAGPSFDVLDTPFGAFLAKLLASGAILVVSLLGVAAPLWFAGTSRGGPAAAASRGAFLSLGNCFSAGLLLGMGTLHFLPEAVEAHQRRANALPSTPPPTRHPHEPPHAHSHSAEDKFVFGALLCGLCIPLLIDTIQQSLTRAGVISSEHGHSHSHSHSHSHGAARHSALRGDATASGDSATEFAKESSQSLVGGVAVDLRHEEEAAPYGTFRPNGGYICASDAAGGLHGDGDAHVIARGDGEGAGQLVCKDAPNNSFVAASSVAAFYAQPPSGSVLSAAVAPTPRPLDASQTAAGVTSSSAPRASSQPPASMSSVVILACLLTFHGLTEGLMLGLEPSGSAIASIMVPLCIHKFFDAFVLGLRMVGKLEAMAADGAGGRWQQGAEGGHGRIRGLCQRSLRMLRKGFWAAVAVLSTPISLVIIAVMALRSEDRPLFGQSAGSGADHGHSHGAGGGGHSHSAPASPPPSLAYIASQAVGAGSFLYIALGDILPMEFHGGGEGEAMVAARRSPWHRWRQLLWVLLGVAFVYAQSIVFPHKH